MNAALAEMEAIRSEIEAAADRLLMIAVSGLELMTAARSGSVVAMDGVERALCDVVQTCSFHDLAGQRLSRLGAILDSADPRQTAGSLMNGPAMAGEGLDQAAADDIFGASFPA